MAKAEIVGKIIEQTGMSRKDAAAALEIFLESIKEGLMQGEKVSLVGFGAFYIKRKRARNGRNPRTGEQIQVPPKAVAAFKPGKAFRMAVNGGVDAGEEDYDEDEGAPPESGLEGAPEA